MFRFAVYSLFGYVLVRTAVVAAQPVSTPEPGSATPAPMATAAAPESSLQPVAPIENDVATEPTPPVPSAAAAAQPTAPVQPVAPSAPLSAQPQVTPPPPSAPVQIVFMQPKQRAAQPPERDRRKLTFGVGPLVLANVHWLDQLSDSSVTLNGRTGSDQRYPGFAGLDAALGLMLDVRYEHVIGVEVDLLWQKDRGTGTITVNDAGSLCFIPGTPLPYVTAVYDVTIGQRALHVPVLFKLSVPGRWHTVRDGDTEREIKRGFATFAFGPEFVFPGEATLRVAPGGLDYPLRAAAANYIMYTGAIGAERRLLDASDLRLVVSVRGSYNPSIGGSAMKRGQYDVVDGNIVPIAYKSEWRYQAALTLGLGWFF